MAWRHRQTEHERRRVFPSRVHRSAAHFEVRRGEGCTIIAGYPWYGERGRDTFVALRGLCLASGRVTTARRVLLQWADALSDGMLPNGFGDRTDVPEYHSVDASLWFVIAVHDLVSMADGHRGLTPAPTIAPAVDVLRALRRRHGIHVDCDRLLAAGTRRASGHLDGRARRRPGRDRG
jgi:predicted glycogen debranching enzyme